MHIPVERLVDGIVATLRDAVMPDVGTRFARGQLYAVLDVLQNLRDRIEPKAELVTMEADSAATALARVVDALGRERAATVAQVLDATAAEPPASRVMALRAAVVAALALVADGTDDAAATARAALGEHLAAQALRDVALLKPSLLQEMSKG